MSDDEEKLFTQEEVNQIMTRNRKGLQQKAAKAEELEIELQRWREKYGSLDNDPPPPPDIEQTRQEIESEKERLQREREELREQKKVTALASALSKSGCTDPAVAIPYFLRMIQWEEAEQDWVMFVSPDKYCTVEEGVKNLMPDYWRPASMRTGGSGTQTGSPKRLAEYDKEEEKLKQLRLKAEKTCRMSDVEAYMMQKKRVQAIRTLRSN